MIQIELQRLPHGKDLPLPTYATSGAAGLDVVAGYDDLRGKGAFSTIYLGVGIGIGDIFHTFEEVNRK